MASAAAARRRLESALEPYVIRQGDYLLSLAHQFGFNPDSVWNDDKNAKLRQLRPDPNILLAGDVLYIPDQNGKKAATHALATGTTNTFVSDAPTVTVSMHFLDDYMASQPFTVQELPNLAGLTTDGEGRVTFSVPVTLATATLSFQAVSRIISAKLGGLDPIDTLSGVFQRLQHLGYVDAGEIFDDTNLDLIRTALRALKAAQGPAPDSSESPDSAPPPSMLGPGSDPSPLTADADDAASSTGSEPPSAPDPGSDPPPSAPASSPAQSSDALPSSSSSPGSDPPSAPSSEESVPSSSPPSSSSAASSAPPDNGGLNDDGTLDDATRALLLQAHEA
jgi:hypothetical protein